jgi:hypothetical protein
MVGLEAKRFGSEADRNDLSDPLPQRRRPVTLRLRRSATELVRAMNPTGQLQPRIAATTIENILKKCLIFQIVCVNVYSNTNLSNKCRQSIIIAMVRFQNFGMLFCPRNVKFSFTGLYNSR